MRRERRDDLALSPSEALREAIVANLSRFQRRAILLQFFSDEDYHLDKRVEQEQEQERECGTEDLTDQEQEVVSDDSDLLDASSGTTRTSTSGTKKSTADEECPASIRIDIGIDTAVLASVGSINTGIIHSPERGCERARDRDCELLINIPQLVSDKGKNNRSDAPMPAFRPTPLFPITNGGADIHMAAVACAASSTHLDLTHPLAFGFDTSAIIDDDDDDDDSCEEDTSTSIKYDGADMSNLKKDDTDDGVEEEQRSVSGEATVCSEAIVCSICLDTYGKKRQLHGYTLHLNELLAVCTFSIVLLRHPSTTFTHLLSYYLTAVHR